MSDIDDMLENPVILDRNTGKFVRINMKSKKVSELSTEECVKQYKIHEGCGGFIADVIGKSGVGYTTCSKCGMRERKPR